MSDVRLTIDASQALSQLEGVDRAVAELTRAFSEAAQKINTSFSQSNIGGQIALDLEKGKKQADKLRDRLQKIGPELTKNLSKEQVQEFAAATASAEAAVLELDKAIVGLDPLDASSVERYEKALDEAAKSGKKLKSLEGDVKRINKQAGIGRELFAALGGALAGVAAGISFGQAVTSGIQLNIEYERVKTSLTTILKDSQKADALLGKLSQFAASTPFQSEDINRAATQLLAFGEAETTVVDRLREIGTISAATGKDFNELTEIYGKARVAGVLYAEDINQLVNAGVPIIQEFAKQLGVSESEVKKLASEGKIGFDQLQTAFRNITGPAGQFNGLLEAQSKTLGGILSTLRDNFALKLRDSFSGVIPIIKEGVSALTSLISATKEESQALEDQRIAFIASTNQLNLSNTSADQRLKIITDLKSQYPQFLGQIDAEKATNAELQPILDKINQSYIIRIALQKQQEKLRPILEAQADAELRTAKQRVSANVALAKAAELAGVNLSLYKSQEDQVKAVTEELKKQARFSSSTGIPLNEEGKALERLNAATIGTTVQGNVLAQQTAKVTKAQEEQASVIEQLKKTYGELFDIATATPEQVEKATAVASKTTKSVAQIAFENREKDLALRRLLLNDLDEGLDKELEKIALHFESLKIEYEKAGLDIATLNENQNKAEVSAISAFLDKQISAENDAIERQKKASKSFLDVQRQELEEKKVQKEFEIALAEENGKRLVVIAEKSGAKQADIEKLKNEFSAATQQARLTAEIEFQEALLAITDEGDTKQIDAIKRRIALLKSEFQTLTASLQDVAPDAAGKKTSIWDLIGIDVSTDEGAEAARAIEETVQRSIAALQELTAARVEAANAAVSLANDNVSAQEQALQTEIQLAEMGFASNVSLKQRELEESKKAQEKAIENQRKAQRTQVLLDTALQASSLATAVANLFKSLTAALPFGTGVAVAIALSATMFAAFAKSKLNALKATRARYGLSGFIGENGIVKGRTHAQGGQVLEVERGEMFQVGDDGGRRRVEVVRRENTKKYFDLLRAANEGDDVTLASLALDLSGKAGQEEIERRARTIEPKKLQVPRLNIRTIEQRVLEKSERGNIVFDVRGGERQVKVLEAILAEMKREKPEGRKWVDEKTVRRGSFTTTYK